VCADDCLPAGDLVDVLAGLIGKSIVDRVVRGVEVLAHVLHGVGPPVSPVEARRIT
jgi:hypothetical protein